jgi:hypothetical protein
MKNIRTTIAQTENGPTKFYCAKDVCKAINAGWHAGSLTGVTGENKCYMNITTPRKLKGKRHTAMQKHTVLSEAGVEELCKAKGVNNPLIMTKLNASETDKSAKTVAELTAQVGELKKVVAAVTVLGPNTNTGVKEVIKARTGDDVLDAAIANAQARKEIRVICEEKATQLVTARGIKDGEDRQFYFDLTYTALYAEFKNRHENGIDLIAEAAKLAEARKKKISALQAAEILGHAVDLLALAKTLFVTTTTAVAE